MKSKQECQLMIYMNKLTVEVKGDSLSINSKFWLVKFSDTYIGSDLVVEHLLYMHICTCTPTVHAKWAATGAMSYQVYSSILLLLDLHD